MNGEILLLPERSQKLKQAGALLEKNKQEYAQLITQEMGKPLRSSISEIEKCAWACEYFAENAEKLLAPQTVPTGKKTKLRRLPSTGNYFCYHALELPVLARCSALRAPNLMTGNATLLRHAPICTGTGLVIEKLFREAGFPENLFRTLIIDHDIATQVIRHSHVKGVTLTGSPRTGSIIGGTAGASRKKVVLEFRGVSASLPCVTRC